MLCNPSHLASFPSRSSSAHAPEHPPGQVMHELRRSPSPIRMPTQTQDCLAVWVIGREESRAKTSVECLRKAGGGGEEIVRMLGEKVEEMEVDREMRG